MLRLDTTTRKLQIVLSGAITTNQLPVFVCWSDKTATSYTGGSTPSTTNSTTAVDICTAPAASTVRDIDSITVQNGDTAAATATIRLNDNGTTYTVFKAILSVGDQLIYTHGQGWKLLDSSGNIKGTGGSGGTPAGSNTQVQFNNSGAFGASSNFTWDGSNVTATGFSTSGNMGFTGTGNRITGDFSNATVANRAMFQTSTSNGETDVIAVPLGSSTTASFGAINNSTPTNAGYAALWALSTEIRLDAGRYGAGTYLPMTFYTGGAERLRLYTNGQITGGNSAGSIALGLTSTAAAVNARIHLTTTSNTSSVSYVLGNSHASINKQAAVYLVAADGGLQFQVNQTSGAEPTSGTPSLYLAGDGAIYQKAPAGLGYGTGAGGTVTQATNRTTGVTLNKPTGDITLFTAAGSATAATFTVTNSLVAATDVPVISVRSATNKYLTFITNVAAGSFDITFYTTGGTASDTPIFHFNLGKGVNA